eukprot:TRINITY_DN2481_c0_g1_i4.p1 TRINITY_DN2481_c0_g1~~TRINITY_DN2481_c0_g1_i4.p1  ORF type:complete len:566 (-),score=79.20 TRINITY_DN2481_c0_g1_i4:1071-2768(-)
MELPPVHAHMEIKTVLEAVSYIRHFKITKQAAFFGLDRNNPQQLQQNFIKPSGPRRAGEGVEDGEQGIIKIEIQESENAGYKIVITVTQLIAGFIIGPNGISIRDLMRRTKCHVKSSTENPSLGCPRRTRIFLLEGQEDVILKCLDVMLAAVDRYKDLAEGKLQGHYVNRIQKIKGYVFYYYPPPRNVVPNAAGIKGLPPSKRARIRTMGFSSSGSYVAYLEPICNQITSNNGQGPELAEKIRNFLQLPEEEMDDVGIQYGGLFPELNYDREMSIQLPNGEELDPHSPTAIDDLMYTIKVQEGLVTPEEGNQATLRLNQISTPDIPPPSMNFYPQQTPQIPQGFHGQPMYPQHISPHQQYLRATPSPVGGRQVLRDDFGLQELLNEAERMGQALGSDVALLNNMLDELNNEGQPVQGMTAHSVGQLIDQQPPMTFNNALLDMNTSIDQFLPSFDAERLDISVPLGRYVAKSSALGKDTEPITGSASTQFTLNSRPTDFVDNAGGDTLSIQDICKRLSSLIETNYSQPGLDTSSAPFSGSTMVTTEGYSSINDDSIQPSRDAPSNN